MKKIFTLFAAFTLFFTSYAATSPAASLTTVPPSETPVLNAKNIMLPVGKTGNTISLMDLANISVKDFESLSGKKMGFFDKIGFKLGQKKLRNKIEEDGTIKSKLLEKYAGKTTADGETGFHLGGFALGFLLGLIGILIAYLIKDEKKSNRVKWAWIGLAAIVVINLIIIAA